MSNSNLIQYQKITEPENLNFVFPLSRYNQELNGLKNNFYSLELALSYDIKNIFPVKNINIRPTIGYQHFLGSIYQSEKWNLTGYNFSIGFNYTFQDIDLPNNYNNDKQLIISDTIIIRDTTFKEVKIDKTKYYNLNNLVDSRIVSKDKTTSTKTNEDYILEISTIKENIEVINYTLLDDEKTNTDNNELNLVIPNLDIKYINNGNLTDTYFGKVDKELYDYTVINVHCEDLLNLKLIENSSHQAEVIRDTIYTYNYPIFKFNLDVFSENEIKNSKLILNGYIENENKHIYSDTIKFKNKTEKVNYNIEMDKFLNGENLNLLYTNSKFKTNTNLKDFTINYQLIIEDTNSNIDSTISGEILLNNTEDKPKKANRETIYKVSKTCFSNVGETKIEESLNILNLIKLEFTPKFVNENDKYFRVK